MHVNSPTLMSSTYREYSSNTIMILNLKKKYILKILKDYFLLKKGHIFNFS